MARRGKGKMARRAINVCKTGYIKCNKRRFWDAAVILYRPNVGLIRVAFGSGDNLVDEDIEQKDVNGNRIDDYLYITTYEAPAEESGSASGIVFPETDGGIMLFSHKSWPSGDIRDMIPEALDFMGWPARMKDYYVVGYEGQFWERPHPLGYRPKEGK